MKKLFWILFLCCLSGVTQALEVGGAILDDTAHLGNSNLVLNGAGVRSKFIFDVYAIGLYLNGKKTSTQAVFADPGEKRITLQLLRDVNSEELLFAFQKAIEKNHSDEEMRAMKEPLHDFEALFHIMRLRKGDTIYLDYQRGLGTQVRLNGSERGNIAGAQFYTALLKIWLGDQPAQDDLKLKLLGSH